MEKYFIIRNSDGDTHVDCLSKEELLERLKEESTEYMSSMPDDSDTNYWGEDALIIKGEIVAPFAKRVVKEFDIK